MTDTTFDAELAQIVVRYREAVHAFEAVHADAADSTAHHATHVGRGDQLPHPELAYHVRAVISRGLALSEAFRATAAEREAFWNAADDDEALFLGDELRHEVAALGLTAFMASDLELAHVLGAFHEQLEWAFYAPTLPEADQ